MQCNCVDVEIEGEVVEVVSEVKRKAREICQCTECLKEIQEGEVYQRELYKDEDDEEEKEEEEDEYAEVANLCLKCLSVRNAIFCRYYNYGTMWEDLELYIEEQNGQISEDCLAAMTPDARGAVCELIEEVWKFLFENKRRGIK